MSADKIRWAQIDRAEKTNRTDPEAAKRQLDNAQGNQKNPRRS